MNYAFKMGSGALIYVQSFLKAGSPIQKLVTWMRIDTWTHTHTHTDTTR
jgi:hypothetical protein